MTVPHQVPQIQGPPPIYAMAYQQPPPARMTRRIGAPLAVLIVAGVLAGALLAFAGVMNPLTFFVGLLPTLVFFVCAIFAYLWLDRWEPEPVRLLIFAFLWGAGVAAGGAVLIGLLLDQVGMDNETLMLVVEAPVVEEGLKGALLLVMLTGRRRAELNSLVDYLVYAGFVGLGFAFVEDVLYISSGGTMQEAIVTAVVRLVMGLFAHPFFTSATAIGLYYAVRAKNSALKAVMGIGGFLGALALHATWNGSVLFGPGAYFGVYALILVPLFAGLVVIAVRSRIREGKIVRAQLPRMIAEKLVLLEEAVWLANLAARSARNKSVKKVAGRPAAKQMRHFTDVVTELAFLRDRIDRGFATNETVARHAGLVDAVAVERSLALPHMVAAWRADPAMVVVASAPWPPRYQARPAGQSWAGPNPAVQPWTGPNPAVQPWMRGPNPAGQPWTRAPNPGQPWATSSNPAGQPGASSNPPSQPWAASSNPPGQP